MDRIPTLVFETHAELAREVAARIAAVIRDRNAAGATAVLGLATGSTPVGVYRELIRLHREEGLSFRRVVTFNLDEYWPMDRESIHSYHRFMWENLFSQVDIDPGAVHVLDGQTPRDAVAAECEAYEAAITRRRGHRLSAPRHRQDGPHRLQRAGVRAQEPHPARHARHHYPA